MWDQSFGNKNSLEQLKFPGRLKGKQSRRRNYPNKVAASGYYIREEFYYTIMANPDIPSKSDTSLPTPSNSNSGHDETTATATVKVIDRPADAFGSQLIPSL